MHVLILRDQVVTGYMTTVILLYHNKKKNVLTMLLKFYKAKMISRLRTKIL